MTKIKITANAVLSIVKAIFDDEDVNFTIADSSAPQEWQGKKVEEILNVEYYTFKHRPTNTQKIIDEILSQDGSTNHLAALDRAFCLLSLGNIERLFSKDVDMAALNASLEYYIQTDKVQLVESMIEDCNIATSGLRIPVQFGEETRKAVIFFGRPIVSDILSTSPFGEMAFVEVGITILLYPNVISYSDYTVKMTFNDGEKEVTATVPLSSLSTVDTMTQESTPRINDPHKVGTINLSNAKSFVLVCEGYKNPFIDYIADRSLSAETANGNNEPLTLIIERDGKTYTHSVVLKDHQMVVQADTGNETHTLTLTPKGV